MNYGRWAGVIVGILIAGAVGLELWTFSEIIYQQFTGTPETERTSSPENSPDDQFTYGHLEGRFKILHLRLRDEEWRFYCVMEVSNRSDENLHLTVTGLRFQSGDTVDLTVPMILEPGVTRSVQFDRGVPAGSSPTALKIDQPRAPEKQSRWIQLPKVPVQRD